MRLARLTRVVLVLGLMFGLPVPWATAAERLKVSYTTVTFYYWPLWTGIEEGLFREAGLEIEPSMFRNVSSAIQAISGATVPVAVGPTPDGIIAGILRGAPMIIVAGQIDKALYDLVAQPKYRTLTDLRGTTLAVGSLTAGSTLLLKKMLQKVGLEFPRDYQLIEIGGTPDRVAAVKAGGVSAGMATEPATFRAADEGLVVVGRVLDFIPEYQFIVIGVNTTWAREHRDALVRFLRAHTMATRWLYEPRNRERALEILVKHVKVNRRYAEMTYQSQIERFKPFPRDGRLNAQAMKAVIDLMVEQGKLKEPVPFMRFVDYSYLDAAAAGLR